MSRLKAWSKRMLRRFGVRCLRERSLPRGLDLCVDLSELPGFQPVRTVIDVGANVGEFTRLVRDRFPEALVLACEPIPGAFSRLSAYAAGDDHVLVEQVALGAAPGRAVMEMVGETSELNRIVAPEENRNAGNLLSVQVETLDRLVERHAFAHVDLLKIDTEGYELRVLHGAERTISHGSVKAVFAECTFREGDDRHTQFVQLENWLRSRKFECLGLYDVHHVRGRFAWGNALFVRTT